MALTIREGLIARKYTDRLTFLQVQVSVPANSTIVITSNPPTNYFVSFTFAASGSIAVGQLTNTGYLDDTIYFSTVTATTGLEHILPAGGFYYKREVRFVITNNDSVAHVADFYFQGYEIEINKLNDYLRDISDSDIKDNLKQINNKMSIIIELLAKTQVVTVL